MDVQFSHIKGSNIAVTHPSCFESSSVRDLRFYYMLMLITDMAEELVQNL